MARGQSRPLLERETEKEKILMKMIIIIIILYNKN